MTAKPPVPTPLLSALLAALLVFAFALYQGLYTDHGRDYFIYRLGAELVAQGENPYDISRIRQHVAAAYPDDEENTKEFVLNCGYFLPPLAVIIFLPLAIMPALAAKVCWALLNGIAAFAVAQLPKRARPSGSPPLSFLPRIVVPFVLLVNPLTLSVVFVGQVSLLSVGCIAAGLWCIDRGRFYLAAMLWVLPFMKPHLAISLIPLLWFLAGWRPAVLLVALVSGMNLVGATVVGGSPRFVVDYLEYLSNAHKVVGYNRVELNPSITSWNCLLYQSGGPLVELNAATTVAGYLVWFGLAFGRVALAGTWPTAAWAVAVVAVGAVFCAQVLLYELVILVLLVPWVRELFADGNRIRGWLAVGLLSVPFILWQAFEPVRLVIRPSLAVAVLALVVLTGPSGKRV